VGILQIREEGEEFSEMNPPVRTIGEGTQGENENQGHFLQKRHSKRGIDGPPSCEKDREKYQRVRTREKKKMQGRDSY